MKELVLLTALIIAGEWDAAFCKVPNRLIAAALLIGFGLSPSIGFIIRFMAVVLIGAAANALQLVGAADVKLYALICAFTGLSDFFRIFALSVFIAGAMSVIKIIIKKKIRGLRIPMAAAITAGYIIYLI